jgi:predicted phosphodiesterase
MQFPNLSFPCLFQAPLLNRLFEPVAINIPRTPPSRVLLLSDTHLGAAGDVGSAKEQFIIELLALIAKESITHIFHLGDLVEGTIPDGPMHMSDVLGRMNACKIPVTVIGGNHDRDFVDACTPPTNPLIRVVRELAIRLDITPPAGDANEQRIFLAHDLGNNYRVRDELTFIFLHWLKTSYPGMIREEDWLLTGHCHMGFVSVGSRLGCVGQFSPEIRSRTYGLLTIDENSIDFRLKQPIIK